jgi:hypothetical protein
MKLSEEHQFGGGQVTTVNHQKLKVGTKDIVGLRLKSAGPYGSIVLLRISLCRGSAVGPLSMNMTSG